MRSGKLSLGDGRVVPLKAGPVELANEVDLMRRDLANAKTAIEVTSELQRRRISFDIEVTEIVVW
jgi:hypothetical protein